MESLMFSEKLELKVKQVFYVHVHKLLCISGRNQVSKLNNYFDFNVKRKN